MVHAEDPDVEDTRAQTTLDAVELERSAGDDLARSLGKVPGVTIAAGTADAAKLVIRGHRERRLLTLYDGVRHESQKWGPDHATEIDPFTAGSITVVRGAAGARYGSDAIGGVVLVAPSPLRDEVGVGGTLLGAYGSNGRSPYGALRVDVVPERVERLSLRVEGNGSASATLSAPDYLLGNTASRTYNLGGAAGYRWEGGGARVSWHHHAFVAGVFYGVRNSSPVEFEEQLSAERPLTADLWERTYEIDRPYQQVSHDIGLLRVDHSGAWGSLEATYAYQHNRRLEFEQTRSTVEGPQYDFLLRTHSVDAVLRHTGRDLGVGELAGAVGLQGTFQENVYRGYALLPNYRSFGGGVFAYERLSLARFDLEVGARLDGLGRVAYLGEDDFGKHVRRETLDATTCDDSGERARCPASYSAGSVSVGGVAHLVPSHVDVKLDLSSARRFPNVDELYLIGNAPSFPVYALGSPGLGVERARGVSVTALVRHDVVEGELSAYGQLVDDYIYFAPDLNDAGEPQYDVTIQGTWPRYVFRPIDARWTGLDGSVSLGPLAAVGLDVGGSLVRAVNRADDAQLVGTPADRLTADVVARLRPTGMLRHAEARASTELVDRQRRVDPTVDIAPTPTGYALFGLSAEAELGRDRPVRVGVVVRNLLNTSYRDVTSLLRYYADLPGRDVRVRVGMDF